MFYTCLDASEVLVPWYVLTIYWCAYLTTNTGIGDDC